MSVFTWQIYDIFFIRKCENYIFCFFAVLKWEVDKKSLSL